VIHKADAVIDVSPYDLTYDGDAHSASGTATGVGGVDLSALLDLSGTTHTDAGFYTDGWSFAGNANYNPASGTIQDVIHKADAVIDVSPYDLTYDGDAHSASGTATGVGGVDLSALLDLSGTTHTDAGFYTDGWSFAGSKNYNAASGTIQDVIHKAD